MDGLQVGSKECSFVDICDTLGKCSSAAIVYDKWKDLARQLNLPPVVILRLEKRLSADIIDEPEAIYQIIYNWRSISSYEATLHKLIEVFEHIKLRDAADELRQAFGLGVITKRVRPQKYIHGPEQLCSFLSSDKIVLILSTLDSKITCDRIQDTSETPLTFFPIENSTNQAGNLHHASDNVNVCVTSNCASIISQLLKLRKKTVLVTEENINDLVKDLKNEKNIYFSTDIIKWSELSQTFQQQILQRCELLNKVESLESFINGRLLVDLINDPFQVKLKDSLPPKLSYYIPRRLKTRFYISPDIFTQRGSNDIYLFTGLERYELTAFAQENPTDTSRNQLAQRNISSRFILLEMKRDIEKICNKTKHGVHWLHYDEGQFTLLKSKGDLSSLQDHVDKHQKEFTEDDFLSHFNFPSIIDKSLAPVCISDSPGMGKSILLGNIGRKLKETGQSVIFVVIEEFITKLKTALLENNVLDAMIRVLGSITFGHENTSKLSTALLKLLLLSGEGKKFELLFDGLDELNPKDFGLAYKCLKLMAKTFKSGRLWVTTRLHLLTELENNLEVLGYNITPFDEQDQVNFFVSYWSQYGTELDRVKLQEFSKVCLSTLKQNMTSKDEDIAGVPLQCLLIADVYEESAVDFADPENVVIPNCQAVMNVQTIADLYEALFAKKINAFFQTQTRDFEVSNIEDLMRTHVFLSLKLIFPEWAEIFKKLLMNHSRNTRADLEEAVLRIGIVESTSINSPFASPRFVHRTFAEYFIAWFVVQSLDCENFEVDKNILYDFILANILGKFDEDNIWKPPHSYGLELLFLRFWHKVTCYFVNKLIAKITTRDASSSLRHFVKMDKYRSFIREMTLCTVTEDYFYLFEFLNDMNTFEHEDIKTIFTPNLAYVLIGQCNLPFVKLVLNHYDQDQVGAYKKDNRSILNVAVERGEYSIVEFLIYSQGFRRKVQKMDVPNLLHDCVTLSLDNDSTTVQNKIQIVKLLVNCNPLILEEVYEGARPIHRRRIHIRLLIELIKQGADVLSLDGKQCCLLHTAAVYLTPEEYFQILNTVSTDALKKLVTLKEQYEQTPLHLIVESERHLIEDNILKVFHDHGADFNSCNEFGETVLTSAIKEGRDKKILEKLIGFGADYKFIHNTENSMLHVAVQAGNLDAVKFLVGELGLDTNAKNGKGLTPLHASLFGGAENRFVIWDYLVKHGADETLVPFDVTFSLHEAIQRKDLDSAKWCIEKGADVNARNKNGYTSLHQVLAKLIYNGEDRFEMTKLLLKHGAEVNAVNRLGETPLSFALNRPAPPTLKIVAAFVSKGALNSAPIATLCLKRIVSESGVGGLNLNPVEYVKLAESCVQKRGIISYTDQEGNTMLHFAASSGCSQGIKYLMSKSKDGFGLDVNASNKEGNTPLHSALIKHDDDKVVNLLVDFGTNLALINSRNHTVFHTAIKHKRYYSSKYLFETENFYDLCGEDDFLKFVAAHGSLTIFKLVCEKFNTISGKKVVEINGNINESNFPDRSCLHPAVRNGNHEVVKYLLNTQGFKNCLNQPRMRDILHVFVEASRYTWLGDEIPKLLIKAEPNLLLQKDSEGKVPLLIPGTVSSLLKCLVQLGADIRSVDENGDTVLHIATSYRTWTDYKKLLKFITRRGEGSLLCARGRNKATVLHRVAAVMRWNSEYWGMESVLDYFVAQNVDFNAVDEAGDSILAYAIRGNCKPEDLETLMKRGATNLRTTNFKRQGLLHEAVRAGNIGVLKFLFESVSDWDLNATDGEGNTLIHYAVMLRISWETDAVDMIKRLLDFGADLNCRNKNGDTVAYLAPQYMSALDYDDFVSVALAHDKRAFNHKCQHQRTPLHNAVECLELRLCTIEALAAHEDLNAVDEHGSPIIFSAVRGNRSADFIRQLVQLGADWRQTDRIEANALHIAASEGHLEAAKYFMELGLSPEDVDLNGKSAVEYAKQKANNLEMVQFLMDYRSGLRASNLNAENAGTSKTKDSLTCSTTGKTKTEIIGFITLD